MSFLENYHLELTVVSPIHIGSQENHRAFEYLPDFDKRVVHILDIAVALNLLEAGQQASLLRAIKNGPNLAQKELRRLLSFGRVDFSPAILRTIKGSTAFFETIRRADNAAQLELRKFIQGLEGPYIPGSSIKGALRTGWLQRKLNSHNGEKSGKYGKLKNDRVHVKDSYWQKAARRRPPYPLPLVDSSAAQQFEAHLLAATKENGDFDATRDPLCALRVSDSSTIPTQLERLGILHLNGKKMGGIPDLAEVVPPSTRFSVQVRLQSGLRHYRDNLDFEIWDIMEACSEYFWNLAERELKEAEDSGWDAGVEFYDDLLDRVGEGGRDEGSFLIRFGYGTGAASKTYIENMENPKRRSIRVVTRKTAGHSNPKDGFPLGWAIARLEPR